MNNSNVIKDRKEKFGKLIISYQYYLQINIVFCNIYFGELGMHPMVGWLSGMHKALSLYSL
jgi:hypothetical protein